MSSLDAHPAAPAALLREVSQRYGSFPALDRVSFEIPTNVITGLLGRNGAGKTTLMQILTGHRVPSAGEVRVFGQLPYENSRLLSQVCFVKENQTYPQNFQVRHVLSAAGMLFPYWDETYAEQLADDFALPRKRAVRKLSRGMLSAVGIVVGLASRAPLTFFDEPYLGLDAPSRQLFYDRLLADYADHPRTIVLSTHLIDEVSELLEHIVLIERGRIVLVEEAERLRGSAATVVGPAALVDRFVARRAVLQRESIASYSRATVLGALSPAERDEARTLGLDLAPVSMQQLVVLRSQQPSDDRAPTSPSTAGEPRALIENGAPR